MMEESRVTNVEEYILANSSGAEAANHLFIRPHSNEELQEAINKPSKSKRNHKQSSSRGTTRYEYDDEDYENLMDAEPVEDAGDYSESDGE
jgi:hypothetical protein